MAKQKAFSNVAFQSSPKNAFHLAPQVNNFNSVFNTQPLDESESHHLQELLVNYYLPGRVTEAQVEKDLDQLKILTAEIKAIRKQGIVLTGERIQKAKELLKPYRDGAFTRWIDSTFGSRRTAYNMLSYYQLYSELPNYTLKEGFKKLPYKVAYLLASKVADLDEKVKIIEDYCDSSTDELLMLLHDRFPTDPVDGRKKEANKVLINTIELGLKKLLRRKEHLSAANLAHIERLGSLFEELLGSKRVF
jgi:hypothetical protein